MALSALEALVVAEYHKRFGQTATTESARWCPHEPTPRQAQFLAAMEREALYGGSAGGGKSLALLMSALQHVQAPQYRALLIRRTYRDLALPGALMDISKQWLSGTAATWRDVDKAWVFPSGAVVQFGYMETERDKYRYQGSQYQFVGVDELTQLSETQYTYLMSRVRKTTDNPIPLRVRAASNPGNLGHKWVHARFVDPRTRGERAFVPATLDDNPHLDAAEYEKMLSQLDKTTYQQLRHGVWLQDDSLIIYPYSDVINGIDEAPKLSDPRTILGVDFGASTTKKTTAFTIMQFSFSEPNFVACLESQAFDSMIPSTIAEQIRSYQDRYDLFKIVGDAGALGAGYVEELRRRYAIPIQAAQKTDKRGYIRLMRGALEQGHLKFVRSTNTGLIEEMGQLVWKDERQLEAMSADGKQDPDDHLSDSALYSWREARYWQAQAPEKVPQIGTVAHADYTAKKMLEEAQRKSAQDLAKEQRSKRGHL